MECLSSGGYVNALGWPSGQTAAIPHLCTARASPVTQPNSGPYLRRTQAAETNTQPLFLAL